MYHSISGDPEPGVTSYYRTVTSPSRFAEQMQWLREHDYRGVSLHEGLAWLDEKASDNNLPINPDLGSFKQPVALTFDDGFRDFHTAAFPILQACGFTATMYLPTSFNGK
jgi:peptidoglycan/xylan/chitin deacetylase (PgdA/CDA1 family)